MKYLTLTYEYRKQLYLLLGGGILLLFALYVYLVNQTVMHVVAREEAEIVLSDVRAEVGALELSLINTRSSITLAYAEMHGFVASENTAFIARNAAAEVLSFADVNEE